MTSMSSGQTIRRARISLRKNLAFIAYIVISRIKRINASLCLKSTHASYLEKPKNRQGTITVLHLGNPCNCCVWGYKFREGIKCSLDKLLKNDKCDYFVQAKYLAELDPRFSTPREVFKDDNIRKTR